MVINRNYVLVSDIQQVGKQFLATCLNASNKWMDHKLNEQNLWSLIIYGDT